MAQTVEDVLARRTRLLFLDAKAAMKAAELVGDMMAAELKKDDKWKINQVNEFNLLAQEYLVS